MKARFGAIITLGFALFAMFFGAGNLVLPPMIGFMAGKSFNIANVGFFITGILAPFLGVLTIIMVGTNFRDLKQYLPKTVVLILHFFIILCIGPLIAIPRTGATTFEVGVQPLFPHFNNLIFEVLFFIVVAVLSISPGKVVDVIGKYLTPILIITLSVLIIWGIVYPLKAEPQNELSLHKAFQLGFLEGYQTLDVLGAVIFTGIIVSTAVEKGFHSVKQRMKACTMAGIIAMLALTFIYGGLLYLGATSSNPTLAKDTSRTALLLYISQSIFGMQGMYIVSVAMAFACLTTAIALTSATASFFEDLTAGKIPYKVNVVLCSLVALYFSVKSVDEIIAYAVNVLLFIYPIVLALIVLVLLFGRKVKSKVPYSVAILVTALISLMSVLKNMGYCDEFFSKIKSLLPLNNYSLEWLLPALLSFLLIVIVSNNKAIKGETYINN